MNVESKMKEVDYNDFLDNYDEYIESLRETGEVWLLVNGEQKELVVLHKDAYEKKYKLSYNQYMNDLFAKHKLQNNS